LRAARGAQRWEPAPRRCLARLERPELCAGAQVLARDLRLAVGRDDRIWLSGRNGAGKTTLLRELAAACTLPPERLLVLPQDLPADAGAALARSIAPRAAGSGSSRMPSGSIPIARCARTRRPPARRASSSSRSG
jgi:hypothetical protein